VSDDHDPGPTAEEPSAEDFEAAAEERPDVGVRPLLVRVLKFIGVLFVVLALLLYLVVPFYMTYVNVPDGRSGPRPGPRPIPSAPEPTSTPLRRV
jgi:hypothetical protein